MLWALRKIIADFLINPRGVEYKRKSRCPNLEGDRSVEWAWIAARIPQQKGYSLEVGNGGSNLALVAAISGYVVLAIDLEPVTWLFEHERLSFKRCDLFEARIAPASIDLILNCSVVEHIGLSGRYGITNENPDGDLEAMRELNNIMKPDGLMLMTVPVGLDKVYTPLHRIYGKKRLPQLLNGFVVQDECYWVKNNSNKWIVAERNTALEVETDAGSHIAAQNYYGLGCFALIKSAAK